MTDQVFNLRGSCVQSSAEYSSVVLVHIFYQTDMYYSSSCSFELLADIYLAIKNAFFMWGVPIFFMISGYLLLPPEKEIPLKKLFGKYVLRIAIALFIFGSLFSILELLFSTKTLRLSFLLEALSMTATRNTWAHLWYLYALLGVYIVLPLLKMMVCGLTREYRLYVLIVLALTALNIPFYVDTETDQVEHLLRLKRTVSSLRLNTFSDQAVH